MAEILVTWPGFDADDPATGVRLRAAGHGLRLRPKLGARSPDEVASLAAGCAAALVSTDPFPAVVLGALPDLRVIARVGVGTDSIDLAAATDRGVAVTVTPGLNAVPVAEHTLALILALLRRIVPQDAGVRAGRWERTGPHAPLELAGRRVGLVGAGTIGAAVARRLRAFDAEVLYVDPADATLPDATRVDGLDALLALADVVSLHIPLLPSTRHLIDARAIAAMRPGSFLVNTARGGIVDEDALFAALRDGRLAGAALDVFEVEPPDPARLAGVPNLLVAAHMGGLSRESIARMTASATDSILRVLEGERPPTAVNPAAFGGGA